MEKRGNMSEYISKLIETKNLIIKDITMEEVGELQDIFSTWEDNELIKGELPPEQHVIKQNYFFKSIYSKHHCKNIGVIDIYHGYPNSDTLWISIFVLHKDFHNKGFGQEVIEALEKDATDTIYCKIGLVIQQKNLKALQFWTKAGFDKINGSYGDKVFGQDNYNLIGLGKVLRESYNGASYTEKKKSEFELKKELSGDSVDRIKYLINDIRSLFYESDIYPFPSEDLREIEEELESEFQTYASNEIITADFDTYWTFIAGLASGGIENSLLDALDRYNTKNWLEKSFYEWFPKYRFMERFSFSDYERFNYTYQLYEKLRIMILDVVRLFEKEKLVNNNE
jgi:GNAT superfamily N-acetyltransferase